MIIKSNPDDYRDIELKKLAVIRHKLIRQAKKMFLNRLILKGTCPIEVIHDELQIPENLDKRFLGVVTMDLFRRNIIRRVSYTRKRQSDSHGSPVGVWELADYAAAKALIQLITIQIKNEAATTASRSIPKKGIILNDKRNNK